jgi:hypothetical protein
MAQGTQATNTEFQVAFNGLLTQARAHGVDTTDENVRAFLVQTAEVLANDRAELREAYNANHRMMGVA